MSFNFPYYPYLRSPTSTEVVFVTHSTLFYHCAGAHFPHPIIAFYIPISSLEEEVRKGFRVLHPYPVGMVATHSLNSSITFCSTPDLRLRVNLSDGGRTILGSAPLLANFGILLHESVCSITGVHPHSIPVSWCGQSTRTPFTVCPTSCTFDLTVFYLQAYDWLLQESNRG